MNALTGWWYNMKADDIDNDGDIDRVLANRGSTAWLKETSMSPAPFTRRILTVTSYKCLAGILYLGVNVTAVQQGPAD